MEPISSAFETLAEIAGALLGFAAIAFALARRPEELESEDRVRLLLLLSLSVVSVLGGILPHVLAQSGQSGPSLWRSWSFAYVVTVAQVILAVFLLLIRMTPDERAVWLGHTRMIRGLSILVNGILLGVFVSQALNALAIGFDGEQWVCLAGLLFTVVQAAVILVTIVFLRPARSAPG